MPSRRSVSSPLGQEHACARVCAQIRGWVTFSAEIWRTPRFFSRLPTARAEFGSLRMAPGTPGPSGAKVPLEPFPVPQRTLDLRREDVYLRITLCVHEPRARILPRAPPRRARAFSRSSHSFFSAPPTPRVPFETDLLFLTRRLRVNTHTRTHTRTLPTLPTQVCVCRVRRPTGREARVRDGADARAGERARRGRRRRRRGGYGRVRRGGKRRRRFELGRRKKRHQCGTRYPDRYRTPRRRRQGAGERRGQNSLRARVVSSESRARRRPRRPRPRATASTGTCVQIKSSTRLQCALMRMF